MPDNWFWPKLRDVGVDVIAGPGGRSYELSDPQPMALLGVRAGLTNPDAFERHPFHRGGHDGAVQSWFRSKLVSGKQYQFSEQVGFGAAVHRGLQLLDAVDGAFDGAGVVGQGQPGDDGK